MPVELLAIWFSASREPFEPPLATTPQPPLKMIVLPLAPLPPSVIPCAAVIVTPFPVFSMNWLPTICVPVYTPGPTCRPTAFPALVTPVTSELREPPTKWMPAPVNPVIVRMSGPEGGRNTTLLTFWPTTRPLVPGAVPVPSSWKASAKVTPAARASVTPVSCWFVPTAPRKATGPPTETVSRWSPSTVEANVTTLPALIVTSLSSVTAPVKV